MSVTAPLGFAAAGVRAGIRRSAKDLAALTIVVQDRFDRSHLAQTCNAVQRHKAGRADAQWKGEDRFCVRA